MSFFYGLFGALFSWSMHAFSMLFVSRSSALQLWLLLCFSHYWQCVFDFDTMLLLLLYCGEVPANFFVSQSISCSLRLLSVLPLPKITFRALCSLLFLFPFFSADPLWVLGVCVFMNCSKVSRNGSKIVAGGGDKQMILKQISAEWNHHHFW